MHQILQKNTKKTNKLKQKNQNFLITEIVNKIKIDLVNLKNNQFYKIIKTHQKINTKKTIKNHKNPQIH